MPCLAKLLGFVLVLSCTPVRAQSNSECPQRTVTVGALEMPGLPIKGLETANFKGTYQGQPLNISSARLVQELASRIVILLDTSGSMHTQNKWRIALSAASELVSAASPRTQISLFTFSNKVERRWELTSEHSSMDEWLRAPSTQGISALKGKTALFTAVMEALQELDPAQTGDAIYVITDGGENASAESKSRVDFALRASGTRLFTFLLNNGPTLRQDQEAGRLDLHDLTLRSGGFGTSVGPYPLTDATDKAYIYDENVAARIRAWTQVLKAEIGTFYTVRINTPLQASKSEKWTLEVVDARGRKRKEVIVTYPQPLMRCGTPSARR
jgi:hypothetical protein